MSDYEFTMPWPPTVNHHHQPVIMRKGKQVYARIVKGEKARQYSEDLVDVLINMGIGGENIKDRLHVTLTLRPPTLRKYDIDNRTKSIFDTLSECGFWADDEQVDKLTIIKGDKIKGGEVLVKVCIIPST